MADNRPVGAAGFEWLQRNSAPIDAAIAAALPPLDVRAARARQISQGTNLAQYQPAYAGGPTGLPIQFPANPNAGVPALIRRASEVPNEPWLMAHPNEVSMPAPTRPAGEAPPVRFRVPMEGDAPSGNMPRVVYGNPDPYQGLSLLAAMKMNQAAKPVSTQEQALHALGNFAQTNWARKMAAAGKETDPKKQAAIMQEADTGYQNVIEQLAFGGDAMKQFMAMAMRQSRGQ